MTVRDDSIDRRLEFLQKDYQRGMPPVAYQNARPTHPQTHTVTAPAGPKTPYLKARTIQPSKKNRQLMRQVSALGMEDPVFGTTEEGPEHPSNIFDDMGIGDLPLDMRDLVSIASDPTADGEGGGLDESVYRRVLGSFKKTNVRRNSIDENEETSDVSEESIGIPGGDPGKVVDPPSGMASFQTEASEESSNPSDRSPRPSAHLLEKLNASIQSLPSLSLEDAVEGIQSPPQSPTKKASDDGHYNRSLNRSKTSIHTTSSKTNASISEREESIARMAKRLVNPRTHTTRRAGIHSASNLKYSHNIQAPPRAPVRQATTDDDMLQVYARAVKGVPGANMHVAVSPPPAPGADFAPSALHRGDSIYQPIEKETIASWDTTKRGVLALNSSLLVAQPENMHIPPSQPGIKGDEPLAKSRAMPNISNLFPVDSATSRRARARKRLANNNNKANSNKTATVAQGKQVSTTTEGRAVSMNGADTVSEMTIGTGLDTASLRAVKTRNTNSVFSDDS